MLCAISGQAPEEPVTSIKSGYVFERRLIEKALAESPKCPVTGEELTKEDLLPLKHSSIAKPRPVTTQTIPGLLAALQNEWDALMLESFQLKKQLDTVRQELSHALYQHDAACRVIARLMQERDTARAALANVQVEAENVAVPGEEMEEDGKLPKAVLESMAKTSERLTKKRRKRVIHPETAQPAEIAKFEEKTSVAPHSTAAPGVLCVSHANNGGLIATGGMDSVVVVYDSEKKEVSQKLTGHGKAVRAVLMHPSQPIIISASDDATTRMWTKKQGEEYKTVAVFKDHTKAVRDVCIHPTNDYVVSCSMDSSWNFYDLATQKRLQEVQDPSVKGGFTCGAFHPDGLLLGTGVDEASEQSTCIWEMNSLSVAAKFGEHKAGVSCVSFSENGYFFATGSKDGTVKLWDLRKLKNLQTLTFQDSNPSNPTAVNSVAFDYSGLYLAVCTDSVKIFDTKTWNEVTCLRQHSAAVTDCAWGDEAHWLVTTSMDRQVKRFEASESE